MKITIWQLFKDALFQPKKHAAYRLLSIGKIMQYLLVLASLITVISFIQFSLGFGQQQHTIEGFSEFMANIQWLLYPLSFIFLFIMNTSMLMIRVSIYAALALVLLNLFKRRGEYRMLWRTAALSMTLGYLVSTILSFFSYTSFWIAAGSAFITLCYLYFAIQKYPKQPNSKIIVPNN